MSDVKPNILLVEDEASLRMLVKKILERSGYPVLEAETSGGALALWKDHQAGIGLLLTDMILPDGMQGTELAGRMQSDKPSLAVIFTSGYTTEVLGQGFVERDRVRFLQKPFMPSVLTHTIEELLGAGPRVQR